MYPFWNNEVKLFICRLGSHTWRKSKKVYPKPLKLVSEFSKFVRLEGNNLLYICSKHYVIIMLY